MAGILAGYGETSDGKTDWRGDYSTMDSTSLGQMRIAPGSAPGAQIYPLKIFGCNGSSDLVMEALDWALDPNGDHDYSDHLDIVNLSLGSDYSAEDDPENAMIDKLASYGVLSVVAAGNAGDITLVGGSPGNAMSALTVADSVGDLARPADGAADTLNRTSSRGSYGSVGTVKPDVAAPGTDIVSAGMGTGNAAATLTGTSMSAPHVAGIAALVKQAHSTWTTAQVKSDVMNTAVHDVTTAAGGGGNVYGPNRVGSGRVDASLAASNTLLAYDSQSPSAVSASFGVVEVPAGTTVIRSRRVTLQNLGSAPVTANLSYQSATTQSGVSFSVSPTSVPVAAGATGTVTITMTASGTIGRTMDSTMNPVPDGFSREFTPLTSGRLLIDNGSSTLRLPVSAAVKPVTTTTATANNPVTALTVTGTGFDDSATTDANGYHGYTPMLSVFALGGTSPKKPACTAAIVSGCTQGARDSSGDLRYVGASSDYKVAGASGTAYFAVNAWSNWTVSGTATAPYVDIWTSSDPATHGPDFEAFVATWYPDAGEDYVGVWLYDFASGTSHWVSDLNGVDPTFESNVFDTDTLVIPVPLADLAPDAGSMATALAHLHYQAGTYSPFGYGADAVLDQIPSGTTTIAFNPTRPGITALHPSTFPAGSVQHLYWSDTAGTVPVSLDPDNQSRWMLVLHQDGASGRRAQVLSVGLTNTTLPAITGTTAVGKTLAATNGAWSPAATQYRYQWYRNGVAISGATAPTHALVPADLGKRLTVTVSARRPGYPETSATSVATGVITAGSFSNSAPPNMRGTTKAGFTLTASNGSWSPAPSAFTYQWYRSGVPISGARAATYKLTGADAGKKVAVSVTVSLAGYTTASRTSPSSVTIAAGSFSNTSVPKITGTAKAGYTLTASKGTWTPTPSSYLFQWYRSGVPISGARTATYKLTGADTGKKISIRVTVAATGYTTASATSALTAPIAAGSFLNTAPPKITGTAKVASTLTASKGTWTPTPSSYLWQWLRNGAAIAGATAATYRPVAPDVGKRLTVRITARATGYLNSAKVSPATPVVVK